MVRKGSADEYSDFIVNRERVLNALLWLKAHNKFYENIEINQVNLEMLPQHGSIVDMLQSVEPVHQDDEGEVALERHRPKQEEPVAVTEPLVTNSGVPVINRPSQSALINQHLANDVVEPVPWPNTENVPINEFREEGYIARAFPALFPTGRADFRSPRTETISPTL